MEDLIAFYQVMLGIFACIIAFGGALAVVDRLKKPQLDINETVKKHSEQLDSDNKRLKYIEEGNRMQNRCMLQMMNHMIDGNHVEQLRETRDAMQDFLANR